MGGDEGTIEGQYIILPFPRVSPTYLSATVRMIDHFILIKIGVKECRLIGSWHE